MSLAISSLSGPQPASLFEGYQPLPGVYDEMFSAPGVLRPHWREFVDGINALGRPELGRRWEQAQRLIRENGISYNVHGDPTGRDRPWELDGLPLLLPATEWNVLAEGLAQRARLLNMILADLYLVRKPCFSSGGHLPPELAFAHPGFPATVPSGSSALRRLFAFVRARTWARLPDGRWLVLADRAQTPFGAGYAVENRIVISRMLPNNT